MLAFTTSCLDFTPNVETKRKRDKTNLQILARISPLPVANRCPVGLGATEMTGKERNELA